MKKTIEIKSCNNGSSCGSHFAENPYWGSKEGIAAGEDKRVRTVPITVGKALKKAA